MAFSKLSQYVLRSTYVHNGLGKLKYKLLLLTSESVVLRQFGCKGFSNNSYKLLNHGNCSKETLGMTIHLRPLFLNKNQNLKDCSSKLLLCRPFHTTSSQKAIPPLVWVVLRPFANVAAVLFGRLFRRFWQRLSPEKRDKIILSLRKRKRPLLGNVFVCSSYSTWFVACFKIIFNAFFVKFNC